MRLEKVILQGNKFVTITAYLLDNPSQYPNITQRPAVVIYPGVMTGNGKVLTSQREAECIAMAYLAEGYQAFLLEYTMPYRPQFPAVERDVQEIMDTIYENRKRWEVDTEHLAAVAFSEGAYAACIQAMTAKKHRPTALILGYPQIVKKEEAASFCYPVLQEIADKKTPPVFLFSTYEDEERPASDCLRLLLSLDKKGVPFEIHLFQKGAHGLALGKALCSSGMDFYVDSNWAKWFELSIRWLEGIWGEVFSHDGNYYHAEEIGGYTADTYIRDLVKNPDCMEVVKRYLPEYKEETYVAEQMDATIRMANVWVESPMSPAELEKLNQELKKIPFRNGSGD